MSVVYRDRWGSDTRDERQLGESSSRLIIHHCSCCHSPEEVHSELTAHVLSEEEKLGKGHRIGR